MECPFRHSLSYLQWHEDAEKRSAKGEEQTLCMKCERFVWPDQEAKCPHFVPRLADAPKA